MAGDGGRWERLERGAPGGENSTGAHSEHLGALVTRASTEGVHGPRGFRRALEAMLKVLSFF